MFAVITAAFMLTINVNSVFQYSPGPLSAISDFFGIVYVAYLFAFAFFNSDARFKSVSIILSIAGIILFSASILSIGRFSNGIVLLTSIYPLLIIYSIALPTLVLILFGFYLLRSRGFKHSKEIATALFAFAVALFFIYQIYIFGYKGIGADDEAVIAYNALRSLLAGHNPYLFNSASVLTKNISRYGFTMLTNNTVVGRLDYPALYMFAGFPFYALFTGSVAKILDYGNALGYLVTFLLSLFTFGLMAGKKSLSDLKIMAPAIFVFILYSLQIVSLQYSIAIIFMLFILKYIDNRYAFVILGIAASLQELLWVPVLLALAYTMSTKGIKQGLKCAILTGAVFLLINGYFIAIGPGVFVSQVFKPLNGNLIPFYVAPISSIVQSAVSIPLSGFGVIFYILLALSLFTTAYSANKITIFAGMVLSYFALSHSLIVYYLMPVAVIASAFVMDIKISGKSRLKEWMLMHRMTLARTAISVFIVVAIALVLVIVYFHGVYSEGFGIYVKGQTLVRNNNLTFDRVSVYSGVKNDQNVYMLGFYYLNNSHIEEEGLAVTQNSEITNSSCIGNCSISGYMNFNLATLHKGANYIYLLVPKNATSFDCSFYRGKYFYTCPPIYIAG